MWERNVFSEVSCNGDSFLLLILEQWSWPTYSRLTRPGEINDNPCKYRAEWWRPQRRVGLACGGERLSQRRIGDSFVFTFLGVFKFLAATCVLFWGHWYPCFEFLVTSPLSFKARVGSVLFACFAEAIVMYIPWNPTLVLHLPISWWPALQSLTFPHASAEVGVSSGLDGSHLQRRRMR